jgi:hypothetical protein
MTSPTLTCFTPPGAHLRAPSGHADLVPAAASSGPGRHRAAVTGTWVLGRVGG